MILPVALGDVLPHGLAEELAAGSALRVGLGTSRFNNPELREWTYPSGTSDAALARNR